MNTLSIAICLLLVSACAAVPSDSTGVQAWRAQDFINAYGMNTHLGGCCTAQYNNLTAVAQNLRFIGIQWLRDSPGNAGEISIWQRLANATGVTYQAYIGEVGQSYYATQLGFMGQMVQLGIINAIEGPNEADDSYAVSQTQGATVQSNLAAASAFQANSIFPSSRQWGVPAIQISFGNVYPYPGDFNATGDQSAYADYGNAHSYPEPNGPNYGGVFGTGLIDWLNRVSQLTTTPGRPMTHSEFGYTTGSGSLTQTTHAKYILNFGFAAWNWGVRRMAYYALYDDGSGKWGWFNSDYTPRPIATAVSTLFSTLTDTATDATCFTPGQLNVTFTGLPAGQYVLFQRSSDGHFILAIWNDQQLVDSSHNDLNIPTVPVTVSFGSSVSVKVTDPLTNTITSSTGSSIQINLPTYPLLLEITLSNTATPRSTPFIFGSQTMGTADPIFKGPYQAFVSVGQTLAIQGITISDGSAATNQGKGLVTIKCNHGTLSTTVGGQTVTGSGTLSINYASTLSGMQEALANVVYTAANNNLADAIYISLTDPLGQSISAAISVFIVNSTSSCPSAVPSSTPDAGTSPTGSPSTPATSSTPSTVPHINSPGGVSFAETSVIAVGRLVLLCFFNIVVSLF